MDTKCQCEICGNTKMVIFSYCLLNGWPKCCNQRMIVREVTIDMETAIAQALTPIDNVVEVIIHRS